MMAHVTSGTGRTANDRFKQSFGGWVWGSVTLAAVFHFALFECFPTLTAADLGRDRPDVIDLLPLPPDIDIPEPPPEIPHPKVPMPGSSELDESLTIHPTTLIENPVKDLPPPPAEGVATPSRFVPYTVSPELKDPGEAFRIVQRKYPPLLKAAGIGGRVTVLAHVDTLGRVIEAELAVSSGNPALDDAAREAVKLFRFIAALNRDRKVSVWVRQVIVFEVK
ncbi:MAG: energy transducer TonB [Gemmatimonadales bacterium]|jgi:protein TonB